MADKTQPPTKEVPIQISLKIAGLVFWGLVIIGLILVTAAIEWLNSDLKRHSDSIENETFILTQQVFKQSQDASRKNVKRALKKVLESTGATGLSVESEQFEKIILGEFGTHLNKSTIYFDITPSSPSKETSYKAKLQIYQVPVEDILNTQKKRLMTGMVLMFFAFGMLLQWVLKKMISNPIEKMVRTAQAVIQGEEVWFDNKRRDEFGYLANFINSALSSLSERQQELSYQASHDDLTGLFNRSEFDRRLHQLIENVKVENHHSALCYIDLDQFKIINDTCGHIAGDELLRQVAHTIKDNLRESDIIARLGGDEFGVLLHNCIDADAIRITKKILDSIRKYKFVWEKKHFQIGASIGVVPITPESDSANELLSRADIACYAAKDKGRNQVHIYLDSDKELDKKRGDMHWVNYIKQALKDDNFILYFQTINPVVQNINSKVHYEILLRIIDKDRTISPVEFMGAAEIYGLMIDIDLWVIKNTLAWMKKYENQLTSVGHIAINISGQSLSQDTFLSSVMSLIHGYDINTEKICFEITETSAIGNIDRAINFIKKFKLMGCKFALDDFGSGMSSFSYLKNLNVDYLKIDGSYVKDIVKDPIDLAMVDAVNDIGHALGIKTIAEFVEDEDTLNMLSEVGVDYAQGYFLSKPIPLSEIF